jgi:apolipoprotein D and lipocalin family protein
MNTLQQAKRRPLLVALSTILLGTGCAAQPELKEIRTESYVDLDRFMGNWYVIASIPTAIEKNIYNATETYRLDDDGTIATTFSFRKGSFDGKQKTYNPRGFIRDTSSNAEWGMQFIWPFKADYRVVYVDEDYSQTIIGRNKRDYAWIMARTPTISNEDLYQRIELLREQGYDIDKLQVVPQRWGGIESNYSLNIERNAIDEPEKSVHETG